MGGMGESCVEFGNQNILGTKCIGLVEFRPFCGFTLVSLFLLLIQGHQQARSMQHEYAM